MASAVSIRALNDHILTESDDNTTHEGFPTGIINSASASTSNSDSPSPRILKKSKKRLQKQFSMASASSSNYKLFQSNKPNDVNKTETEEQRNENYNKKKQLNLFPCPLVKTLDLDSPEGSLSSLGIVSGLNHYNVPFASSTSYTLACQQQYKRRRSKASMPPRAKSVQSPSHPLSLPYSPIPSWPTRQQSLPACTVTPSPIPGSVSLHENSSPSYPSRKMSPSSRSPRAPMLKQTKSLHAQTHKLKRQVTICEDSISIPDSQLFSRQNSHSDSVNFLPNVSPTLSFGFNHPVLHNGTFPITSAGCPHSPRPLSASPVSSASVPRPASSSIHGSKAVSTPPGSQKQYSGVSPSRQSSQNPRMLTVLKRQESSFTQEEINSLQEAFTQLDLDGNGKLSRKETEIALGKILSRSDLDYFLFDMKTDENGEVEWHEFLNTMKARMKEPESIKMLKEAFRVVAGDVDQNGGCDSKSQLSISAAKMKHSLMVAESRTTEQEIEEMLDVLDLDKDGKIMMEDFVRLLVQENQYDDESNARRDSRRKKCLIL